MNLAELEAVHEMGGLSPPQIKQGILLANLHWRLFGKESKRQPAAQGGRVFNRVEKEIRVL